jgi:hypothetical protein
MPAPPHQVPALQVGQNRPGEEIVRPLMLSQYLKRMALAYGELFGMHWKEFGSDVYDATVPDYLRAPNYTGSHPFLGRAVDAR